MKIQNLFSTGKMNKDVDERLIQNGEYINAKNVRVLNTAGSDAGAIENEKGNVKLTNLNLLNNPECIGSVADEAEEKIYWFIVNDDGFSYIYEYDRTNQITSQVLADERVGDQQVLGFSKDYKITGVNIFYNIPNKEKLLLFTDNLNHPRFVNINRAKGYGLNNFYNEDINLYKKPPYEAPSVTPTNSLKADENSVRERFFAFSYRYKYLDGEFSALSSFSNYQFVNRDFDFDFQTIENKGMINLFNSFNIKYNTGDKRVTDVQICFKTSDDSNIYVAETINKKESALLDDVTKTFNFTNKKIYKQLPPDEIFRTFDNVPLKAKAQDIIEDRVVFGNYTIQYDLKENADDEEFINIDYFTTLKSVEQEGDEIPFTLTNSDTEVTLDLTGLDLKAGYVFYLSPKLESAEQGTEPDTYGDGSFDGVAAIVLESDYSSASDFAASSEFENALSALSLNFSAGVTTTTPPDTADTNYGVFNLVSSTATSIVMSAPTLTHIIDNTPGDADITDGDTTDDVETFLFVEAESTFSFRESLSSASVKSLQSYEVGIVYLDEFGRYSSVLPSKIQEGFSNDIFISQEKAPNINSFQTTINNKPPYWADRYKFFIKAAKQNHYNVFATLFYEEGVYRWVLLEGANLGKVEEGAYLYVKSDDEGPVDREVKIKVLEVTTKNAADIPPTSTDGWIEGNTDGAGNDVIERSGTYMKIKPVGFQMDYNPYNFATYTDSNRKSGGPFGSSGHTYANLPKEGNRCLAGNDLGNGFEYLDINSGSQIEFDFYAYENQDSNNDDTRVFRKKYKVTGNYTTDAEGAAFWKWFDAETEWFQPPGQTYYRDPDNQFRVFITDGGTFSATPGASTYRPSMKIESTEYTRKWEGGRCTGTIKLQLVNGLLIFETIGKEVDNDIFYESEQTFKIENGLHKGNTQDQTSSQPAVCDLNFFNCFSFGNGLESINIRDDRFTYKLASDYRPNITLEQGYKELEVTHGLIHSGTYNENSGYNAVNEFNSSRGITKNLDTKYGSIQKLFSRERDLIVFQEDRVSKVLYGKTILSSPDGTGGLSQIEGVFGQDIPFSGEYGISVNPESFGHYEGRMYFADPNRGAVLRLGGDGITPISYAGMKAFFKENLYNNKTNFNIGGFDPKYHQYVLSMGNEQMPQAPLEVDCASTFTRTITSAFNYDLNLGSFAGTATIAYTTSASIDIVVVYNGNTYTNNGLTGTGSVTFPVTSADLETTNIADVTITPASSSLITLTHTCPEPETLEVILVVVNDEGEANETIINRYKHDGAQGNIYNSDLDVFEADELTRFETLSGFMGGDIIPDNGDTVTLSSLKQSGIHTGDFNDCNSLGYLVSAASGLTVQNIIDQATYPSVTGQTLANGDEENTTSFTFNRNNTSEKLYLVWNYIDQLPVLVDDSVTGITNGGSTTINVIANDTIPSPYTITIGTQPTNGTVVVNADNTITYTHTAEADLDDSFTYIVDRGGTCSAEATVTTQALAISVDTYIYIYFDASGSMNSTLAELQTMRTGALKATLQDLYATAGTEDEGNTDPATNGSNEYDNKVSIVYNPTPTGNWTNEQTLAALSDNDVNNFLNTNTHTAFPADATNVIMMVFQDEASAIYHDSRVSGSFNQVTEVRTAQYDTDLADLRSRVTSLNSTNTGFYRGVVFHVEDAQAGGTDYPFKAFLESVEFGSGNYTGTNCLSDLMSGGSPTFVFEYDLEDSTNNDATAPFKPGSTTDRFDQWQYYYLYWVTSALNTLGFTPDGITWPVIEDDG
jgi:hypothetical protein